MNRISTTETANEKRSVLSKGRHTPADLHKSKSVVLTDDEKIDAAAKRVFTRYRAAFEILAK